MNSSSVEEHLTKRPGTHRSSRAEYKIPREAMYRSAMQYVACSYRLSDTHASEVCSSLGIIAFSDHAEYASFTSLPYSRRVSMSPYPTRHAKIFFPLIIEHHSRTPGGSRLFWLARLLAQYIEVGLVSAASQCSVMCGQPKRLHPMARGKRLVALHRSSLPT